MSTQSNRPIQHISCEQLKSHLDDSLNVTIIDIRDPQSYAAGHFEGAHRIDNSNVEEFVSNTDKSIPLVVCCYHGNSSQSAADYFSSQGFESSASLDGGYERWKTLY